MVFSGAIGGRVRIAQGAPGGKQGHPPQKGELIVSYANLCLFFQGVFTVYNISDFVCMITMFVLMSALAFSEEGKTRGGSAAGTGRSAQHPGRRAARTRRG